MHVGDVAITSRLTVEEALELSEEQGSSKLWWP